jgi:uncharacterized membrane protein
MTAPQLETGSATPATRRWPRYLLIASLALNLLFIGMTASAMWPNRWGPQRGNATNIMGFLAQLPPERRAKLMSAMRDVRPELRALRQQIRAAAEDRVAAIKSETFDKQRYIDAQTQQIEAETKLRLLMRTVFAETAGSMSADERRAFLRWRGAARVQGDAPDPDTETAPAKKP